MTKGYLAAIGMTIALLSALALSPQNAYARCADPLLSDADRSGCCSHHGGVCGCNTSTGMQRCCDGRDSPSCRCGQ